MTCLSWAGTLAPRRCMFVNIDSQTCGSFVPLLRTAEAEWHPTPHFCAMSCFAVAGSVHATLVAVSAKACATGCYCCGGVAAVVVGAEQAANVRFGTASFPASPTRSRCPA